MNDGLTANLEYTSFLVRLWREPPAAGREDRREWLIQVEHIPGGEKEYLASLEDLFAFIQAHLPGQPRDPAERPAHSHHERRTT